LIAGAAAQISSEFLPHHLLVASAITTKNIERRGQHPRRAEATLQRVVLTKGPTYIVCLWPGQTFNCCDMSALDRYGERQACSYRFTIDEYGTSTTDSMLTTKMSAGKIEIVSKTIGQ
jgi:hypothetical protein